MANSMTLFTDLAQTLSPLLAKLSYCIAAATHCEGFGQKYVYSADMAEVNCIEHVCCVTARVLKISKLGKNWSTDTMCSEAV